jgi:hypothetical protein
MNLDDLLKSIREEDDSKGAKIDTEKFLKRKTFENPLKGQRYTAPSIPGSVKPLIKPVIVDINLDKIIPKNDDAIEKLIPNDDDVSKEILEKLDELIKVIKADNELEKKEQDYDRKKDAKVKRETREKRIESKKLFANSGVIKKSVKKIQDIFDTVLRFLGFTLLGQIVKFVTDFLRNPKNKEFIENIQNFVRSIPGRLKEAREKIQGVIDWFTNTVNQVKKFTADFRELLKNAPFLGDLFKTAEEKEAEQRRREERDRQIEEDLGPDFTAMKGGGMIPFLGTDTVPAMLTPGEFVMSRGAVNMFGADTMMAMNKAGGGTNIPKYGLVPGYSGGGFIEKMGMTRSQFEIYKREIAKIESKGTGGYAARGGANNHYDGKYQMGEVAKMDAARILGEQFPGHDAASRAAFRADPAMQERYFEAYTNANYGYMMSDPLFANANPQRKLEILGYAHNQGWSKALDWLNTGEVGRDKFGTAGTKYVNAINDAFKNKTSTPTAPPVLPPPGFDSNETNGVKQPVNTRFEGFDLDFIFKPIREFLGVDTPNAPTSTKIIVLPTVKQTAQQPSTQVDNEIPNFKISSSVRMRGLVGKALGIEDLVS